MTCSTTTPATLPPQVQDTLRTLAEQAGHYADQAREQSLKWFRTPLEILTKLDDSPVTIADREVESVLRQCIAQHHPEHGIWGEEHGRTGMDADYIWVVDPIDGTRSFISGYPLWGTLLAVLWQGRPRIGLIDVPAIGDRWLGRTGQPTLFNGRACCTSTCETLDDASLMCTTPDMFTPEELAIFDAVSARMRMRRFGGDCYGYGLLASGHIDIVIESELQPYDFMASIPVIEGAGGCITDWQGRTLTLESGGQVVASANARLHKQALAALAAAGAA
ncbi:MAG: histidinol-phosphatase [Castellaniella sp.]